MIDFLRKKCKHITRKVRRPREKCAGRERSAPTGEQYHHIPRIPLLSHHCAVPLLSLPSCNMTYLPLRNNSDSNIDDNKREDSDSDVDNKKREDSKSNVDNFKRERSDDNNGSITLPYWGGLPLAKGGSFYSRTHKEDL